MHEPLSEVWRQFAEFYCHAKASMDAAWVPVGLLCLKSIDRGDVIDIDAADSDLMAIWPDALSKEDREQILRRLSTPRPSETHDI